MILVCRLAAGICVFRDVLPLWKDQGLRAEQSLVLNPEKMDDGAE